MSKEVTSSDSHFHLFFAKVIREEKSVPTTFKRIIVPHKADYPFFYHWALSKLNPKWISRIERATSPLSDAGILLLVPFISKQIYPDITDQKIYLVCFTYAVYPALFRGSSGPRVFSGCPRVFGEFLYLSHIALFAESLQASNLWISIFSILIGSLLPITSKFGTQVMVFFLPAIGFMNPQYFVLVLLSLTISYVCWRKLLVNVLAGQINHSIFYFKFLQKDFLWPTRITLNTYIKRLGSKLKTSLITLNPILAISYIYGVRHPANTLIFIFPFHLLFAYYYSVFPVENTVWIALVLSSFVCFFVTSLKWFSFLGESERYLEYSLVPILVAMAYNFESTSIIVCILLCFTILSLWLGYLYYFATKNRSKDFEVLAKKLSIVPKEEIIWPIGSFQHTALNYSHSKVLSFGANLDENVISLENYKLIYGNAPYPSKDWEKIIKIYNPKWILTDTDHLKHYLEQILQPKDCVNFNKIFQEVFRMPSGIILLKRI